MRPLRVAYLPAALRPGGAEKQMVALGTRLPRDRFSVDYLTVSGEGEYDEEARASGARVHALGVPPPPGLHPALRMARRADKFLAYVREARRARYDIVDAWLFPTDVMAELARPLSGTPIIVGGRRNLWDFEGDLGPIERRLVTYAYRRVDALVANSQAVADDTIRRGHVDPAKVHVIRNGVLPIEPLAPDDRVAARARFGMDTGILIGCVGNYREVKRLDLVIDAFAAIADHRSDLRLVLLGEGPLRPELQARIDRLGVTDLVRLHGWEVDIAAVYGAFDVMVQGSDTEGLPNAVLEAAAAGRPIVATAVGGTGEIVVDGRTGLTVPRGDADAMAGALRRMVEDPDLRHRLGAAARDHVADAFGMERFVAEFAALYEGLARAKGLLG